MVKKKYIKRKISLTTAEVNRDVLGDLLRQAMRIGQVIDFEETLKYPLSPIPLSLSFPDGIKRSPAKSSLIKIIDYTQVVEDDAYANANAYILDLTAAARALGTLLTLEEFINQVLSIILRDCRRVNLVADSFREIS